MFGTKSHFRKAPAINDAPIDEMQRPALVLVSHGERGGEGKDRFASDLADYLKAHSDGTSFGNIKSCFLSKSPTLADIYQDLANGPVLIYPLFMTEGYFVKVAIPKMLQQDECGAINKPVQILTAMGLNGSLTAIVDEIAKETAKEVGLDISKVHLLLAAHGSKGDRASFLTSNAMADCLRASQNYADVECAFLEEAPFLDDTLKKMAGPVIMVGLFVGEGMHGGEDLPCAVAQSGRSDVFAAKPLTRWPQIFEMIKNQLTEASL